MLPAPPWDYFLFCAVAVLVAAAALRVAGLARALWTAVALVVFLVAGSFYVGLAGRREALKIQRLVAAMAPTYARELELLGHSLVDRSTPPDDPRYLALAAAEKRWLESNPEVSDIYTVRLQENGQVVLVVDSETDYDRDGRISGEREVRTAIGEVLPEPDAAMIEAFSGRRSFDQSFGSDRWGTWISAYEPMRDASGRVEAVLGVDFDAHLFDASVRRGRLGAIAVSGTLLALLLAVPVALSRLRRTGEELGRRNAELAAARDSALAASQTKSRFLANVSHELRTPLHVFLGMNELLLESKLDERQRKFAETGRRAAEGLLGMVDDLLDFAQLESGKLSSDVFVFDLGELVEAAAENQRPSAESKGLKLTIEIDPSSHARVLSDPRRVRQILRHLIGNAIKFTDRGDVRVRTYIQDRARSTLRDGIIEVADTGIGVPPERRAEVFDSFSQVDPSATRRHGGTGIGLALSHALAVRLGGVLELDADTDRGSVFRLTFPLREPPRADAGAPAAAAVTPASPPEPRSDGTSRG